MENDDLPRTRGDSANRLSGESLDTYSQDELMARIQLLETEIDRVRAHHTLAAGNRKLADSLFSPKNSD